MTSKSLSNKTNYHIQYWEGIESGEIVVSKKIRDTYNYFVNVLPNKKDSRWEYRDDLALHAINFIEKYSVTLKGKIEPLELLLFQKAAISLMFGWVEKGTTIRKHRITHFYLGRKNGKSVLAASIALYIMFADDEQGAELYSVATKKDQAKIIWETTKKLINRSKGLKQFSKTKVGEIITIHNDGSFKPLASDSSSLDGLNPSASFMDEIHEWKDMNLYDVIIDGSSARDNWFVLLTSTAGFVRGKVFDNFYDDGKSQVDKYIQGEEQDERVLYLLYELDKREEWKDEYCWVKANPAIDIIKDREELRRKVNDAARKPIKLKNLLTKEFNVSETGSDYWLSVEDIKNETTMEFDYDTKEFIITDYIRSNDEVDEQKKRVKPTYGIGGFDLSKTTDLTAASVIFKVNNDERIFVKQMYWLPSERLEQRIEEDKVPYDIWLRNGLLRLCEGNMINYKDVKDWFVEIQEQYDIYLFKVGYDSWSANYLVEDMKSQFGGNSLEEVIQGAKTLSNPMRMLGEEMKSKNIVYDRNPIFFWNCTNVRAQEDRNGNILPSKNRNENKRIDGFAALLNAYVSYDRNREDYINMIGG